MIRLLADQNFDERILRGLLQRSPTADILRVREIGLSTEDDNAILAYGASIHRIVLTHDVNTLIGVAIRRLRSGEPMSGVIPVPQSLPVGRAIEDLLLLIECTELDEWYGQVRYLPL